MQEIWLPSNTPASKAIGRFVDLDHEYTDRDGQKRVRTVTVLLHKFPGSNEVSSSLCKDNADGHKLRKEWSQAWELYERNKAIPASEPTHTATEFGVKGTPIEKANFIGKDRISALKMMGFLTMEQLAEMSDTICNNVGFGSREWRKKAAEYLILQKENARRAEPEIITGPNVADLMAQLAEAQATIMRLVEESKKPAEEAPKPRGRPRKVVEAQPEA